MSDDAVSAPPGPQFAPAIRSLWRVMLLRGFALIILGSYALARPGMSAVIFTAVIGVFIIAEGILAIAAALLGRTPSRGWTALRGAIALLAGLFVFAYPVLIAKVAATFIIYVVGFSALAMGLLEIVAGIRDHRQLEGPGWLILGGVLSVLFGILLLVSPMSFGIVMVRILGAFAVISGIFLLVIALRLRNAGKNFGT